MYSLLASTSDIYSSKKTFSLIREIQLDQLGNWQLFKFSETLHIRMEDLIERKKLDQLTLEDASELEAISELDRIFTHTNAMLALK